MLGPIALSAMKEKRVMGDEVEDALVEEGSAPDEDPASFGADPLDTKGDAERWRTMVFSVASEGQWDGREGRQTEGEGESEGESESEKRSGRKEEKKGEKEKKEDGDKEACAESVQRGQECTG